MQNRTLKSNVLKELKPRNTCVTVFRNRWFVAPIWTTIFTSKQKSDDRFRHSDWSKKILQHVEGSGKPFWKERLNTVSLLCTDLCGSASLKKCYLPLLLNKVALSGGQLYRAFHFGESSVLRFMPSKGGAGKCLKPRKYYKKSFRVFFFKSEPTKVLLNYIPKHLTNLKGLTGTKPRNPYWRGRLTDLYWIDSSTLKFCDMNRRNH
jgi:hypothetical protein